MRKFILLLALWYLITPVRVFAQENTTAVKASSSNQTIITPEPPVLLKAKTIFKIVIQGNKTVSQDTVISKIKLRVGQDYNGNSINEDVRSLYSTGFFESVEANKDEMPSGLVITFKVKEKPVVNKLSIKGNKISTESTISKEIAGIVKPGSFVDDGTLRDAVNKIKDFYSKKGYSQANVAYVLVPLQDDKADVNFTIDEKKVVKVRRIIVEGNKFVSFNKIKDIIKTKPAWLFNEGYYKQEVIPDDIKRVSDYYKSLGFSDIKVDFSAVPNDKGVDLKIKIEEGRRYYLGDIKIDGYSKVPYAPIKKAVTLKTGQLFVEQDVYENAAKIREVYMDNGYLFCVIDPVSGINPQTQRVDVSYKITENQIGYIEKIVIRGNTKTKEKVIRRELRVYPDEQFDGKKVRRSKERLDNLGFFEPEGGVRFTTEPGTKPDYVDLITDVKEAKTGSLSFGAGYSSIDRLSGFIELAQKNFDYENWKTFTGGGQNLSGSLNIGSYMQEYGLSFTNPWIFDRPYSFGIDCNKTIHDYDLNAGFPYTEKDFNSDVRFGHEFNDYLRGEVTLAHEQIKIGDVDDSASDQIKAVEGFTRLNSVKLGISYDKRDNVFVPTSGILFDNYFQYTGGPLGGTSSFWKYSTRLSYYLSLAESKKTIVEFKLRYGLSAPYGDTADIPIFEKYYTGGADTIRGYRERRIGPLDINGDPIGGDTMFIGNIELTQTLIDVIKGALFFDAGNTWAKNSDLFSSELYPSYGVGLRMKTPIGPISLDYGIPLRLEPGKDKKRGRFNFNMSRGF